MAVDVTILMPVYNAASYLHEAITSILHQTFTNFEFLIIDDGSTDESVQIIKSYHDKRIRLIVNGQNLGISATLNKGLSLATAELIARMDSDDISEPERIEKQFNYFQQNTGTALLSTSVRVITADKEVVEDYRVDHLHNCYNLNFICSIYHPTVMFKKEVIVKLNGYTCKYSEDHDLWCRLYRVYKIDHLDEMLLDYRLSSNSLSNVDKKIEYDESGRDLVLQNLRFYAGDQFQLTFNEAECYRNVFEPICSSRNLNEMIACIRKLDFINDKICASKNVNYTGDMLLPHAKTKRDYTVAKLHSSLPKIEGNFFRLKTESAGSLIDSLKNKIKRILRFQN
jgi:glycosyltransferase involved in cell wall biosynthesis